MKKLLTLIFCLVLTGYAAHAQEDPTLPSLDEGGENIKDTDLAKRPKDAMILGFYTDFFAQTLPANANAKPSFSGFNYTIFPYIKFIKQTSFGIAAGLGIRTARYKNDVQTWATTTLTPYTDAPNKAHLSTTYINIPVELRYTTLPRKKDNSFKIAIGADVGYNISASTFTQYGKLRTTQQGTPDLLKITKLTYGAHARIAYAHIGLQINYTASPMFSEGAGSKLNGVAVGLILQ